MAREDNAQARTLKVQSSTTPPPTDHAHLEGAHALDEIRTILVGRIVGQLDSRFRSLAMDFDGRFEAERKEIAAQLGGLRDQIETKINHLEAHVESRVRETTERFEERCSVIEEELRSESARLAEAQAAMADDRADSVQRDQELTKSLEAVAASSQKRLGGLESAVHRARADLGQAQERLGAALRHDIESLRESLQGGLVSLEHRATSREDLARILHEMAAELERWGTPGHEPT